MKFLVTGAAGFLGSALANRLVREGHQVEGIDDLSSGNANRLKPEVAFAPGDVIDRHKLWPLLKNVDCVYHLAAKVSVSESVLYPREYNTVNVGGTVSVMEAMRDVGVQRVVFISSGAVYGDQQEQPLRESTPPDPRSPYAVSKLAAEHYVRTIGALWGIETVSLRVFNAYGPNQPLPTEHPPVVPHFLRLAVRGGMMIIHGKGEQRRDFVFVDDVVEAMVAAATAPNVDRRVINVGSGTEVSVTSLVQQIAETAGVSVDWMFIEEQDPGPSRMRADIGLARKLLGFKPRVNLPEGLGLMMERDSRFANNHPQSNT